MTINNIIYITDSLLPSDKANSVNSVKMCEAFVENFTGVTLVCPTFNKFDSKGYKIKEYYGVNFDFYIRQIAVPNVPGVLLLFMLKSFFLIRSMKKLDKVDTLIFGRSPYTLALLALFGYNVALDVHGRTWEFGFLRYLAFSILAKAKSVKLISFNTPQLQNHFKKKFKNVSAEMLAIPNGSDIPLNSKPFKLKSISSLNVGYLGSFHQGRGIELIISIAQALPEVAFHLGGGPTEYLTDNNGKDIPRNVILYGQLPYYETAGFRASCDILIAPYQSKVKVPSGENTAEYMSPIKVFEYMSAKKPIVTSDLSALRVILNDKNAILVPPDEKEKWVSAILSLRDENFRRKLSEQAYIDFLNNYTWKKRAETILDNINKEL